MKLIQINDVIEPNILVEAEMHRRWSCIASGTLDFNEFLSLLLVYRQTDGFSHKDRIGCQGVQDKKHVLELQLHTWETTTFGLLQICEHFAICADFAESFTAAMKLPWHLQEIRQMYRTFCRFAVTDGNNVKKAAADHGRHTAGILYSVTSSV